VSEQIDLDIEVVVAERNRARGDSSRGEVKRDVPPMIDRWMQREPNFAHHLSNEVEVEQAFRPGLVRQRGKVKRVTFRTAVDYHRVRRDCTRVRMAKTDESPGMFSGADA
jgi:hypothetical protein